MKDIKITRTGEAKPVAHGLVDYIAEGMIERDGERIPCEIGFTQYHSSFNDRGEMQDFYYMEKTHIFIKAGITASGHHYEDETIEL